MFMQPVIFRRLVLLSCQNDMAKSVGMGQNTLVPDQTISMIDAKYMIRTPKIIAHIGFHKTGTKSVQTALEENQRILAPHLRCFLRSDLRKMITFSRQFSQSGTTKDLNAFGRRCRLFFKALDLSDHRPIVMSAEDLVGFMPGRGNVTSYAAVPGLMAEFELAAARVFKDGFDLDILLSTRRRDDWLASLWWQNLRSQRMGLGLTDHSAKFHGAADLQTIVNQTRNAVLQANVHSAALEDTKSAPQGPSTPIFDLIDLSSDIRCQLALGSAQNTRPQNGIEDVFLALNRSSFSDDIVSETKKNLLRAARRDET